MKSPKLFLTDYASYNNGTQFQFGHWVDLDDFADENDFADYMTKHFKECDEKSPLGSGSIREEPMFTDFENFPKELYSESGDLKGLFEYINLEDNKKLLVAALMDQEGYKVSEAISESENRTLTEYDKYHNNDKYDLFAMYYPEADKADNECQYLSIDYDRFIDENFLTFEQDGKTYLIDRQ